MKSNLKCNLQKQNGVAEVALTGDLDSTNAAELLKFLKDSLQTSINKLVFLAEGLEYISSNGLKTLIFASQEINSEPGVILVKKGSFVAELIKEAGLEDLFIIKEREIN